MTRQSTPIETRADTDQFKMHYENKQLQTRAQKWPAFCVKKYLKLRN